MSVLSDNDKAKLAGHLRKPQSCLDYCCGDGTLGDAYMGRGMVGVDIRQTDAASCIAEGTALPLKDSSFESVIASAALHHFDNPEDGIRELARVTKIMGTLVIFEVNSKHPQRFLSEVFRPESWVDDDRAIRHRDMEDWLFKHGWQVDRKEYYTPEYRKPSFIGKVQSVVSRMFGHGPLKKYVHSYTIWEAVKCVH